MPISYFDGERGRPGVLTSFTGADGTVKKAVIPAVVVASATDGTPSPAGTSADPIYTSSASNSVQAVKPSPNGGTEGAGSTSASTIAAASAQLTERVDAINRVYDAGSTAWRPMLGDTAGTFTVNSPSGTATVALTPVTTTGASSLVVKASAGNFYGGSCTSAGTAGYFIAYNAAAAPAAGGAITAANVLGMVYVAANATGFLGEYTIPDRFGTGIVLLFSTSTTTFTAAANLPLQLRGRAV